MARTFPLALLLVTLTLSSTAAQDPPARLSKDGLDQMLGKFGFKTSAVSKTTTEVVIERTGWTSVIRVSLSAEGNHIWLDAYLLTITRPEDVPAAVWKRLLAKNEDVNPAAFMFNATSKRLYLTRLLPNADVTPMLLRQELEYLDGCIEKTADVWRLSNFVPPMTPEGEKLLPALAGTWKVTEFVDQGKPLTAEDAAKFSLTIDKNTFRFVRDGKTLIRRGQLVAGAAGATKHLDRYATDGSVRGIFKLDGDTLTWCYAPGERPTAFAGDEKTKTTLLVLKREK
jgi:uncharacterized protein (TIGR03067 family)